MRKAAKARGIALESDTVHRQAALNPAAADSNHQGIPALVVHDRSLVTAKVPVNENAEVRIAG